MTTEEKAKAFDEALERAKKLKETCDNTTVVGWMEYIFQELAEEEKTRKDLLNFLQSPFMKENIADWKVAPWIDWLNKQGDCSAKWEKNTADNKPTLNHSVLMKNIHGIAEGEWNGKEWIQYRWSSNIKDSDVLYWMNLYELEKQGELPEGCVRKQVAEAKEALYSAPCTDTINGQGITNQVSQPEVTKTSDKDWSEEDENELYIVISTIESRAMVSQLEQYNDMLYKSVEWLKSLKDRLKGE